MFTLKQDLGCPRRMTVYAIFDILDRLKSSYDQVMTGDIQAQVSVFGKECLCAFAVTESSLDTSILHITLLQPISDMTKEDEGDYRQQSAAESDCQKRILFQTR